MFRPANQPFGVPNDGHSVCETNVIALVLMSRDLCAAVYQELLDRLERAEAAAAIRQGIAQFERGEGIPLEEVERKLRNKHGFSR